ncbi:MAG TPA: tetratricopeptide repeat protein [bacterium]
MFRDMKRGVKTEDEFQSIMQKAIKFIVRHKETSIWVGIGVVAAIVFFGYMTSKSEVQKPEAELMQTQAIGMISQGRFPDAEQVLTELSTKYSNTRPGKIALYYLGVIYYYRGQFAEALDYFDKFLGNMKNDYLLTPSAQYAAGCAAEGLKEYEKALGYYSRIIKDKTSPFYFQSLLAYGRISGIQGEYEKAQTILKDLVTQNPPPDITNDAKFYIGYFNR